MAKKPLHLFPHEIIEEILSKLPVKSLLIFRCVSKSWRFSINSKFFIKKSLRNATQRGVIRNYTVDDPNNNHLLTDSTVVGSCNGLLCILKEKSFFLWNPTIRLSIELPKIDLQMKKYGFGWDEESDAYKVFAVVSEKQENIGKVYSTKTNSWKTVEHGCLSVSYEIGLFICGRIHWLTRTGWDIEFFDFKSEVFGMMEKPCELSSWTWVEERDGCLSVLCDNNNTRLDSWVMKKYGVKESWVKRNTAPIPPEYKYNYWFTLNSHNKGVQFFPGGNTVNYTTEKTTVKNYIESLVSPVCTSMEDEIEQEQVRGVKVTQESEEIVQEKARTTVVEGRPKRQNKKRGVRCGVEGSKENQEMEKEQVHASVAEGRPKRQNRRKPERYGYEGTKENQEMEKEQVRASVAEGRPKRQNRRKPERYGYEGTKENPEQVRATSVNEGRPKSQNKRKEMEQEQVHASVAESRPKRQNRRRPERYDT